MTTAVAVGGSNVVLTRRQSDRTSGHDAPRGTRGKGGDAKEEEKKEEEEEEEGEEGREEKAKQQ